MVSLRASWSNFLGFVLFGVMALSGSSEEAKIAPIFGCIAAWQETMKAVCLYQMQTGHYPRNLALLQIRHTHCPVSGKDYAYKVAADGRDFILYCPGKVHQADGARPNHPWFSRVKGLQVR